MQASDVGKIASRIAADFEQAWRREFALQAAEEMDEEGIGDDGSRTADRVSERLMFCLHFFVAMRRRVLPCVWRFGGGDGTTCLFERGQVPKRPTQVPRVCL